MKALKNLNDLLAQAKEKGPRRVAVVQGADEVVVEALKLATEAGIAEAIFVGDETTTRPMVGARGFEAQFIQASDEQAADKAVELVRNGEADVLMKGKINTTPFLRAVLNKEHGLRAGKRLSLLAAYELPFYDKLLFCTDSGVNVAPDEELKIQLTRSAVEALNQLGYEEPKVGFLCANERADLAMPATIEAMQAAQTLERDPEIKGIFEGPCSMDTLFSAELAKHKGVDSQIAGQADLVVFPNIETGNALGKSWLLFNNAKWAGVILGATHPIVLGSRSDTAENKLLSLALATQIRP